MALTAKQKCFVEEYLIDLNATQAAIRAGYSPRTANNQINRLLVNAGIVKAIDKAIAERSRRTGVTQDRVIRELARIAFLDPIKVIDTLSGEVSDTASEDDRAAIVGVRVKRSSFDNGESVEREVKIADKIRALELLGRHLGMYSDRISVQFDEVPRIVDDVE